MAGISEDEAFYKIAQAGEFIRKFENDKQKFRNTKKIILINLLILVLL